MLTLLSEAEEARLRRQLVPCVDDARAAHHLLALGLDSEAADRAECAAAAAAQPDRAELLALAAPRTTCALVGASGAGKSTLVNLLLGRERQATKEVRSRDSKGRHTTVARELILVPGGGALIDTPGIRSVGVWADEDALHRVFSDVDDLTPNCRFADCAHDREPDCAGRARFGFRASRLVLFCKGLMNYYRCLIRKKLYSTSPNTLLRRKHFPVGKY